MSKKLFNLFISAALTLCVGVASAATFNLFAPANGVLKGNSNTYVTTAAASSDVISLWSGTCNSSTFMRGDGSCQSPAASSGTVTSVALTVPSGFSVTGSPVTTSGTLAITGTLNVSAGGTGAATLTGLLKGSGTSALSAAASSDVLGLWSGTCSSGTYLRGDGSCQAPGTGSAGGSTTQVQYNNAGSFAGDAGMVYNSGTATFTATNIAGAGAAITTLNGSNVSSGTVSAARVANIDVAATGNGGITGTLPVTHGGSGVTTLTGLALGNGTSPFSAYAGTSCTNQFARSLNGSGAATCASVSLTADVSGALPVANGGTGVTTSTGTGNVVLSASPTLTGTVTAATVAATTLTGAGSGITSLNASNIASGFIADARLSANVPLLSANNTFTASGSAFLNIFKNTTNTGYTSVRLYNDQASGVRALDFSYAGSSYATALVTNGPTGESGSITTTGAYPLSIGTGNTERVRIAGDGSSIALTATAVTVNGQNVCRADGTGCPAGSSTKFAFGRFTVSGACSIASSTNVTSCTYNGAGNVTIGFSTTAGTGGWFCTASSSTNGQASAMRVSGASTSSVNIYGYLSGTLTDTDFTMTCMAN